MLDLPASTIAAIAVTFLAAGMAKGITGMGLPTVAMGVLGALLSPVLAAGLLLVPSFVTNVWQLLAGASFGALGRRLWPMMAALVAGTLLGAALLAEGGRGATTAALGWALVAYALYTLLARQLSVPRRLEWLLSPLVGAATGLVTGATGVFVIPAVPYLQALGLSFTVSTLALAIGLGARGAVAADTLALSVAVVLPALGGMWAGQKLRARISPPAFRRWFLVALLLLGLEMALRPLF